MTTPQKPTDDLREMLLQIFKKYFIDNPLDPDAADIDMALTDTLLLFATQTAQNSGLASKATPKVSGNQSDNPVERLKEIIGIAHDLKWITPHQNTYPLMQLSEVEKCMLAMVDGRELTRMRDWATDVAEGRIIPQADAALTDLPSSDNTSDTESANAPKDVPSLAQLKERVLALLQDSTKFNGIPVEKLTREAQLDPWLATNVENRLKAELRVAIEEVFKEEK